MTDRRRKLPETKVKDFFYWQRTWRERLFQHPGTRGNWTLFALGFYLSERFDWDSKSCFPGRETIARELGVNVRTVSSLTRKLAEMGFVAIKRRGRERSSLYVGTLPPDVQSTAHQEVKSTAHQDGSEGGLMCNPATLDVQSNDLMMCNEFPPNNNQERTPEHIGAAHAAPQNTENNIYLGDGPCRGRPLSGGESNFSVEAINSRIVEILENAAEGFELDPFEPDCWDDPPGDLIAPLPEVDGLSGFVPDAAGTVDGDDPDAFCAPLCEFWPDADDLSDPDDENLDDQSSYFAVRGGSK